MQLSRKEINMSDTKLKRFLIELPFPDGDIVCEKCKLLARSCVGQTHCMITGNVVSVGRNGRNAECPLRPA